MGLPVFLYGERADVGQDNVAHGIESTSHWWSWVVPELSLLPFVSGNKRLLSDVVPTVPSWASLPRDWGLRSGNVPKSGRNLGQPSVIV